jgi:hypothetical protein
MVFDYKREVVVKTDEVSYTGAKEYYFPFFWVITNANIKMN